VDTRPEPAGHVGFFLLGYAPEPFTFYRGVHTLEAGTTLWVDASGQQTPKRFFRVRDVLAQTDVAEFSGDARNKRLRSAIEDTVAAHLLADVPVGVFLSAGQDSVALACVASRSGYSKLKTSTLGFREFANSDQDETRVAEKVAGMLGTDHSTVRLGYDEVVADGALTALFTAMDQPSIDGVNSFFISEAAARSSLKVALSGLGGDELFRGYPLFRQIPRLVGALRFLGPLRSLGTSWRWLSAKLLGRLINPRYAGLLEYGTNEVDAHLLLRGVFFPWELPEVLDPDLAREGWATLSPRLSMRATVEGIKSNSARLTALEMTWYMRNQLLVTADWAGMAHSLEIRVPFVDVDLLRAVAPLITSQRAPEKRDMVDALECNALREIASRPKTGFSVPVGAWLDRFRVPRNPREWEYRRWARFVYSQSGVVP
jgi:asparagine synthase (glutamine-hydrolysing)